MQDHNFFINFPSIYLREADLDCATQSSNEWQCSPSHQAPLICKYL